MQVGTAPGLVCAQEPERRLRYALRGGRSLPFHHMLVELGRTAHGLTGVVDDEVESVTGGEKLATERLNAGSVPQVEAEDLQPVAPLAEVRLGSVAGGRVAGKSGSDNEVGAG